jgi:hypothetical protein
LLLSDDCLEQIYEKLAGEGFGLAEGIIDCPKCRGRFGMVVACGRTGLVALLTPPEKTEQCFAELKQMLEEGLSLTTIAAIISNAKKPQYNLKNSGGVFGGPFWPPPPTFSIA